MGNVIYGISIFYGSLFLGYALKKANLLKETVASKITKIIIRFVSPAILALSFWNLNFSNLKILMLPLVGLAVSLACALPAYIFARGLKFDPPKAGVFIIGSIFSNVGYPLGAFLCFVLFGEKGFGLAIMYCLYWSVLFYTLGFYLASCYGKPCKETFREAGEGLKIFPIAGIIVGALLNILRIPRPDVLSALNSVLIPVSTSAFLFSAGLTLKFSKVQRYIKPCVTISVIKFLYAPLVGYLLSALLGYRNFMDGLAFKVVLIESAMPVAISIMVLPQVFDLDQDLANSLWIFTTFLLLGILPILLFIMQFV